MSRRKLISPEEALRTVLSNVRASKAERVALAGAAGRRLAQDIRGDRDQPPADRSAMDGYAVIAADVRRAPARLRLIGEVAAGSAARPRVRPGTCATILTGANLPSGADAVVQVEHTERQGQEIILHDSPKRGLNIRRRGEEAKRGDVLLPKGMLLGPAQIGVCAMVGRDRVKVHACPKAAVLCTGAEVRDVGERVAAHQLRDSNGPALLAAMAAQGFGGATRCIVHDDPGIIAARMKRALRTRSVLLVTGGVSVGRYDYVPEAVRRIGGRIRFHGVQMKPGKPQLYATLPGGKHIFGLPGNPVSVLTGFHELALPALRKLSGAPVDECRPTARLRLVGAARSRSDRTYFALARVIQTADGPAAAPVESSGSADIIAACEADGVMVIPKGIKELAAGSMVEFHTWKKAP